MSSTSPDSRIVQMVTNFALGYLSWREKSRCEGLLTMAKAFITFICGTGTKLTDADTPPMQREGLELG